jgi:hypothetical protein
VFEIKPNKESAGRILRQLNIYRERLNWNRDEKNRFMILITPDSRFDNLFKNQGVMPMRPILPLSSFAEKRNGQKKL